MASILKQARVKFVDPKGNLHMICDLHKNTNGFKRYEESDLDW